MAQRGVGRIELFGHPEYDWAGTGFLVNETTLMTTRRTAEIFIENRGEQWQFRPGITAWMDYRSPYQCVSSAGYRVRGVFGVHSRYDLALLEVERPQMNGTSPDASGPTMTRPPPSRALQALLAVALVAMLMVGSERRCAPFSRRLRLVAGASLAAMGLLNWSDGLLRL